jgi:hypothetical protein
MNDTQQSFSKMVAALVKPGQDILNSLSPEDCHNLHMIIGLDGEVGELTDALKKSMDPALVIVLGEGTKKVRLAIIELELLEQLIEEE